MKASDLEKELKKTLGKSVISSRVQKRVVRRKHAHESLWLRVKKSGFRKAVEKIASYGPPHLSVISGADLGKTVELLYHFGFGLGASQKQFVCTVVVPLSKKDLTIPTITDLVPGALLTEREKQEFFGVKVKGIPDNRRAFLADDLKKAHPWIKDDKATKKFAREVHE